MNYFVFVICSLFIFSCNSYPDADLEAKRLQDSLSAADHTIPMANDSLKKEADNILRRKMLMSAMCPELKSYLDITDRQLSLLHSNGNADEASARFLELNDSVRLLERTIIPQFPRMDSTCQKMYTDRAEQIIAATKEFVK
jgi:hypothetical protein